MHTDPFVLIDRERRRVFGWLAETHRPFRTAAVNTDEAGVTWLWAGVGESAVGLTWLGPGHVWDADWAAARPAQVARCRESMRAATGHTHQTELETVARGLRLGELARRVLYSVHRAVLAQKSSRVTVSGGWLAAMCWGTGRSARPRHWRSVLREILRGLSWLHVADAVPDGPPAFGPRTVLITHAGDLRGTEHDACPGDCGARGDARHHHFEIDIGPGFLGLLEQFGRDPGGTGVRTYQFPVSGKRTAVTLGILGKTGRVVSVFLPALLGEPGKCRTIGVGGHRVLQALVREATRPSKPEPDADRRVGVVTGGRVRSYSGRRAVPCELLDPTGAYAGFNGNGKRKGMGFRLAGDWGWPAKVGYPRDAAPAYLDDLAGLAEPLQLTVVGVGPSDAVYSLSQLRGMVGSATDRKVLGRIDVRVYAPPDYARRWCGYFGWPDAAGRVEDRPVLDLRAGMRSRGLSCRTLAAGVGCDHSFLSKVLKGAKQWPPGLLEKVGAYLAGDDRTGLRSVNKVGRLKRTASGPSPRSGRRRR